eukprot:s261_g5.t1
MGYKCFKDLKETYGDAVAKDIRSRKYEAEKTRHPDEEPFHRKHPEAELNNHQKKLNECKAFMEEFYAARHEDKDIHGELKLEYDNMITKADATEISLGFETLQAYMAPVPWLQMGLTKSLELESGWGFVATHGIEVVESFNRLASGIPIRGLCGERTNRVLRCLVTDFLGSNSFKTHPPVNGMDEVDEMWRSLLQRFPQYPHWCLVKEKRCVYRMGSQSGKKVVCRVSPGGLQVRVGGGWMAALPFLERYGPVHMGPRCGEDPQFFHCTNVDLPASMERLLVPTKCWAQKIGIRKTPDLREQRRLQEPFEARQSWSRCAPPSVGYASANGAMAPGPYAAPMPDLPVPQAMPETEKQVLQPLPWPGDKRNTTAHPRCEPGM